LASGTRQRRHESEKTRETKKGKNEELTLFSKQSLKFAECSPSADLELAKVAIISINDAEFHRLLVCAAKQPRNNVRIQMKKDKGAKKAKTRKIEQDSQENIIFNNTANQEE
jgi:hypothetical protein